MNIKPYTHNPHPFGFAPVKQEGGSYCRYCLVSAGPGEELQHTTICNELRITMQKYQSHQSHKIVEAADLIELRTALEEDGTKCFDFVLEGEDAPLRVSEETGKRIVDLCSHGHPPTMKAGKLVRYKDGYMGWWPIGEFDGCHSLVEPGSEQGEQPIKGYRTLDEDELSLINQIKAHGQDLQALINTVNAHTSTQGQDIALPGEAADGVSIADEIARQDAYRWAAMARTSLQQGLMFLTRAVAKPQGF